MSEKDSDKSRATGTPVWGHEFFNSYISVADQESHDNPKMHLGLALGLLGECLRDCTFKDGSETCRLHPLIVQKSGSGKESAFNFAKTVADRVQVSLGQETSFDFCSVDNITNGNLVGTQVDGRQKEGLAAQHDIIGLREAKDLFSHADMRRRLRIVMDEEEVTREMRDGTIHLDSSCTVMGTVPPDEISAKNVSDLVSEGTLARPLYFFREIGLDDTSDIIDEILTETSCDTERERSISDSEREEQLQDICATLAEIAEHYSGGIDFQIDLQKESLKNEIHQQIVNELKRYSEEVRVVVQPMLARYTVHALRIATIMAALDECSHKVTEDHLKQAMKYWKKSFSSMLEYFARRQSEISGANREAMRRQLEKAQDQLELLIEIISTPNIRQARLSEELRLTPETIRKHAKELQERGAIEISNTANSARYVPDSNPEDEDLGDFM